MEPHLNQHIVIKKRIFAPFFTVQDEVWENGKDEAGDPIFVTKPISYCSNVRSFLTYVKEDRNAEGTQVLISLDKGKKSIKFSLSLFNPHESIQKQDFLLAVVHFIEENYRNVLKILTLCSIDLLDWNYFCSDLKMTMIVLGK